VKEIPTPQLLMKYSLLIGFTIASISFANVAAAKTSDEVQRIARSTAVEIKLQQNRSVGSGVIIYQQGDVYTLATNRHVICGFGSCSTPPEDETYSLGLPDGQKYQVKANFIRLLGDDLDLAIIQFRSNHKYSVAQVAAEYLKSDEVIYTAGFPLEKPGFNFNKGEVLTVMPKRFTGDKAGYGIIYNADTLSGMSGGGVFNSSGQLVAIHGRGDRFNNNYNYSITAGTNSEQIKEGNELTGEMFSSMKTGFNRGIPIRYLVQRISKMGIGFNLPKFYVEESTIKVENFISANEHFIAGFNKVFEPTNIDDTRQAIQEFNIAIELNPKYANAYLMRCFAYQRLQNNQQAMLDCNQAIAINPNFAWAYALQAGVKSNMNDFDGAIASYKKAISIKPNFFMAYMAMAGMYSSKNNYMTTIDIYNQAVTINPHPYAYLARGMAKEQMNDLTGALADYNQAIHLNPDSAIFYWTRGFSKSSKLNDRTGAIQDYQEAAKLLRARKSTYMLQAIQYMLKQLGATE
jgi:tetratricopeptide (TPR) repeat protein